MKVFFSAEFTGLHQNTSLISIGLVSESGSLFYAELTDYDETQVDEWIQTHIIDHLYFNKDKKIIPIETYFSGDKNLLKIRLEEWLSQFEQVDLVADVSHYDMTLFINIFGSDWDLPKNVSPCCYNINQDIMKYYDYDTLEEAYYKSREEILEEHGLNVIGDKNTSLYDARVIKAIYNMMQ